MNFTSDAWDPRYQRSRELFERAARVIPGGITGHTTPAMKVPGQFPYYAQRAQGSRYWDVDGNEWIDLMCGYGPIVLGHNHPEVREAVARVEADGICFNHPTEWSVQLVEKLVELVDFARWGVLGKNGSDMTGWAIQVARAHTGRKKILKIAGAYHGVDAWCTPGHAGWIEEDREHIHEFAWNDAETFERLMKRYRGEVAGVIVTPFHHPNYGLNVMPAEGFLPLVERQCRECEALLILDDVRAGFRLHLGGSHRLFGFTPDLACYCKALGNGYPIAAAVGNAALRVTASKVFLTGSYWNSPGPMAAALKVIELLQRENGIETLRLRGEQLLNGLERAGRECGVLIACSGPGAMPFARIAEDPSFLRQQEWTAATARRGVFLHPHHNWFVSTAHSVADIDAAVAAAAEALGEVSRTWN